MMGRKRFGIFITQGLTLAKIPFSMLCRSLCENSILYSRLKWKALLKCLNEMKLVDEAVIAYTSRRRRTGPRGLSLVGYAGRTVKGVLVSWESKLRPSPDADAVPRDSVLSSDWRKCSVRASEPVPGSITLGCRHCCRFGD